MNNFSDCRLNAYRVMWLFIFFDLPTNTKSERKNAASFRKSLEKDGFTMLQYSVYTRHCPSKENIEVHQRRVRGSIPGTGKVSMLAITDKQYSEMKNYYGKIEKKSEQAPQQLELF